jgi:hypothetical protein
VTTRLLTALAHPLREGQRRRSDRERLEEIEEELRLRAAVEDAFERLRAERFFHDVYDRLAERILAEPDTPE